MTTDLVCLIILALWSIVLNHIPVFGRMAHSDVAWGLGNRETTPDAPAWVGRADRAQRNHHDNLAMIAVVILTAQIIGKTDRITAIAAIILVGFRLLHSLTYIFGITVVRTIAYAVALGAMLVIVWRIFS